MNDHLDRILLLQQLMNIQLEQLIKTLETLSKESEVSVNA